VLGRQDASGLEDSALALSDPDVWIYGFMFLGQHMPKSEASEKGAKLSEMFKDVGLLGAAVACYLLSMFVSGPLAALFGLASFPPSSVMPWVVRC
jgi:hypothetical protein